MYRRKMLQPQYNEVTKNVYQGRNQGELLMAKEKHQYKSNSWLTFLQAKKLGLKLVNAKGKGVPVFRGFQEIDVKELDSSKKEVSTRRETRPMGYAYVFNMDLTEKI